MKTRLMLAGLLALALGAGSALAHTDEVLATTKSANGGQVRVAGPWHLELVVGKAAPENTIVVYLTDHAATKIPSQGGSGTATILSGREKIVVPLKADGDNRLKGFAKHAADPAMKVIVSVSLDGKTEQARFTPLQKVAADGHADHQH